MEAVMKENRLLRALLRVYFLGIVSLVFIYPLFMVLVRKMIWTDGGWVSVSRGDLWLAWLYVFAILGGAWFFLYIVNYATINEMLSKLVNGFIFSVTLLRASFKCVLSMCPRKVRKRYRVC